MERRVILGTAGHIDHGKTTLVRALTGVDTDRLPEEKRRGITIDLGFAPLALSGGAVAGVVDVPGHEAFVRTMLAGASGVDLALLVIAADEGVMPQTREHVAILGLLGVRGGIVALTKRDLVDDEWLALVTEDVRELLRGTAMERAPIIPASAVSGDGVDLLRTAIDSAFAALPIRDEEDLFRMPVDRVFTVRGTGTVVTGTVWSGTLARDASVRVLPGGMVGRVRGIQSHGETVPRARPAMRAAIALAGVELADVHRGAVLVTDESWQASQRIRAEVSLLGDSPATLRPRTRVRLHLGTQDVGARVTALGGEVAPGGRAAARLSLDAPLIARAGDRFVLRSASPPTTIGGGVVVDPLPDLRRARPIPLDIGSPAERLVYLVREAGLDGVSLTTLPARLGRPRPLVSRLIGDADSILELSGRVYDAEVVAGLERRLVSLLEGHHRRDPLEPGVSLQLLRSELRAPAPLVDETLRRAQARGAVRIGGGIISVSGWSPKVDDEKQSTLEQIRTFLEQAGREPPSSGELTGRFGQDVPALLRFLERQGFVVQVEEGRYYHAGALQSLVSCLREQMVPGRQYSPAELRDVLGISRKYLIPVLEYCDQRGITDRRPGGRILAGT